MTRSLHGFLIRAVRDFTVLITACFALWPALIAVSDREDLDLSDDMDGEWSHLRLAIVQVQEIFVEFVLYLLLFCVPVLYVLYSFKILTSTDLTRCNWGLEAVSGSRVHRLTMGKHRVPMSLLAWHWILVHPETRCKPGHPVPNTTDAKSMLRTTTDTQSKSWWEREWEDESEV